MKNVHLRILIQAVLNKPGSARFPATITGVSSNAISITYVIGVARAKQSTLQNKSSGENRNLTNSKSSFHLLETVFSSIDSP